MVPLIRIPVLVLVINLNRILLDIGSTVIAALSWIYLELLKQQGGLPLLKAGKMHGGPLLIKWSRFSLRVLVFIELVGILYS
jgi:hypothetical protein